MILSEDDLIKTNLTNSHFEQKLSALCEKYLKNLYSNYLFFSVENNARSERYAFNTNPSWYKHFIEYKLINNCPFYEMGIKGAKNSIHGNTFFLWNQIVPNGKKQREVIKRREDHGIGNGISLIQMSGKYRFLLGLASDPKDHELERKYMDLMPQIITLFKHASDISISDLDFNEFTMPDDCC